ncbi:MAG: EAL domain-containing protein [Rubrivivax sp.]|nr:EAL domain-containing protein [Rubrivivax sp.]
MSSPALPNPWQRLSAALMPDYNRVSAGFWWTVVAAGLAVLVAAVAELVLRRSGPELAAVAGAMVLAMLAGLFPMRVPGSRNSFVAGEIFIFVLLLVQGVPSAVVAAAGEAFVGSLRTSRRWTSRLFSPAAAALAMAGSGSLLDAALTDAPAAGWAGTAGTVATMMLFAVLYFAATATLVAGIPRLKSREPFWQPAATISLFRWVGIAYVGSAVLATLLYVAWREDGSGVLWAMLPLVLLLLLALHLHFRVQEAAQRAAEASATAPPSVPGDEALREMQHLAFHDPLTGLPNRRRFIERLEDALAAAAATPPRPFAVMYLDFDSFKAINDRYGHGAGDELLVQLGQRIHERLRPQDLVARLGGDEFAVLVPDLGHEKDAIGLAERLLEALARPLQLRGGVQTVATASIGITFSSLGYTDADAVLRDADNALYKAKHAGRARYAVFDAGLHAAVSERLRLAGQLRDAVATGQLTVEYQPLVELATLRLTGFEALVRWAHPQRGTLHPAQFLALAEEAGLMPQLSDFVLHCACQQLRRWQQLEAQWAGLTMSVNVSATDLAQPGFVARVGRALLEAGVDPASLTLEIREDTLMGRDGLPAVLQGLSDLGVRLAVDDFGTGASPLVHLARLPVDSLKIDRSFVARLKHGPEDEAVVQAIVQVARTLRKAIVAEGIENEAQSELLQRLGCTVGQGFHLGKPLSAQAARAWLQSHPAGGALQ